MARHQDDGTGRCELSELLVTDCSGCRGHSDPLVDILLNEGSRADRSGWQQPNPDAANTAEPNAFPLAARYHGQCTARQGCHISPGDQIISTQAGGYMHSPYCPSESHR